MREQATHSTCLSPAVISTGKVCKGNVKDHIKKRKLITRI